MALLKCPSCGKRLELPESFSGLLSCPDCSGRVFVRQGRNARLCPSCAKPLLADEARCGACGTDAPGSIERVDAALERETVRMALPSGMACVGGMNVPGCVTGIVLSALGFLFSSWAVFLIPAGLLVAGISAFAEPVYVCQSCGVRLPGRKLKECPSCKAPFG